MRHLETNKPEYTPREQSAIALVQPPKQAFPQAQWMIVQIILQNTPSRQCPEEPVRVSISLSLARSIGGFLIHKMCNVAPPLLLLCLQKKEESPWSPIHQFSKSTGSKKTGKREVILTSHIPVGNSAGPF
jgi:hypothetical protein